jgi:hypothetical protein
MHEVTLTSDGRAGNTVQLLVAGAPSQARPALFLVGTAALVLLFVGIHNAWDAVTYHVFVRRREQRETERPR